MKIIDCTTYYSEDLMLDIRFNILNEYVDKFIIVESKYSHSGEKKTLNFNIKNFSKFKDKIEYLIIEDEPEGIIENKSNNRSIKRMNSLLRIEQSYNFISNALIDVSENDLICLSDNDEIPNFESINFKNSRNDIFIFKQLFFYYKFNLFYDLMPWFGTKACKKKKLISLSWLRNLKNKKYPWWRLDTYFSKNKQINLQIVNDGGWHFTNVKTAEDLHKKLLNFGHHNEYEESGLTVKDIQYCIDNKIVNYDHFADKTKINKYDAKYKLQLVDDEMLPKYLLKNKDKYINWFSGS
jgi:beta-1,4-mannosyl-glycoprotein beta-1,4-N-acetylglucosaminyltransferase